MKITPVSHEWSGSLARRSGAPTGVVVHHAAHPRCGAATIHGWHIARKWKGIGYHFVVRKDGTIETGRPEWAIGSHTMSVNSRIGVCLEGNFETEVPLAAQLAALAWLIHVYLAGKYGKLVVTRHRDHAATSCPGKNLPWPIQAAPAAPAAPSRPQPAPATKPAPARPTRREGARKDAHVREIQRRLNVKRARDGRGRALVVDGDFGPRTKEAVMSFQRAQKIGIDGVVGPETWARLLR